MTLRPRSPVGSTVLRTPLRATAAAARALCGGWSPALLGMLMLGSAQWGDALAQVAPAIARNALPTPCSATASCGTAGNLGFVQTGSASVASPAANQLNVTQSTGTALLNWRNFNVGADSTVNFSHIDSKQTFTTINRIYDTTLSTIDGRINATNGQIYLINPNGLLFGKTSVVDVAGLIASTLSVSDKRLTSGLLGGSVDTAAFLVDTSNPLAARAAVQIDPGAVVKAGNVYVFAPTVNNGGAIQVKQGGQVVLAAGQRVFLAGSEDVSLRGLLVEVGQGGTVSNSGSIDTPHGNTTLIGMAVNQAGRITATSALNENGTIRLIAREVASDGSSAPSRFQGDKPKDMFVLAQGLGTVKLASGSTTEVLLDAKDTATAPLSDATAAATRSTITLDGASVSIGGNGATGSTRVQAHGGDVLVSARTSTTSVNATGPTAEVLDAEDTRATLSVGADARIDVSGERDVAVDGNRNYIYIDRLTSNDLRDAPLQREGFLLGQGVYVNVAQPQAFIDLGSRKTAVAGTQAERNASGGNIVLHAEGTVTVDKGAVLDLSGGSTLTSAASGRTSQLLTTDGRVVDIMKARADERYVGFADSYTQTLDAPREGLNRSTSYQAPRITAAAQYAEGKNAGALEIVAPRGTLAGTIRATTTPGSSQRGNLPQGGEVRIGVVASSDANIDQQVKLSRANVLLTDDLASIDSAVPASQLDRLIALDTTLLKQAGVSRLKVLSDGYVTAARGADLDMGPAGSISLQGNAVDVNASLRAHGGSIVVGERAAVLTDGKADIGGREKRSLVSPDERGRIRFGSGVTLDVSGLFTNDAKLPVGSLATVPVQRDGGSISVTGAQVDVSGVQRFNVDGGASVSATGVVSGGKAGALAITAADTSLGTDRGQLALGDNFAARISGFGFTAGGSLTLGAPSLTVGSRADASGTALQLDTAVFDRGFESYTLNAADRITVQAGTQLAPPVRQYLVDSTTRTLADGSTLSGLVAPQEPLAVSQRAANIKLTASGVNSSGTITFETGSSVDAGVQGTLSATAGAAIDVQGRLAAQGGSVSLSLGKPALNNPTVIDEARLEQQAIRLGAHSLIDVSGVPLIQVDALGQRSGKLLDGGSVSIAATRGTFAMAAGAQIRADGTQDQIDLLGAGAATRIDVASSGGAVSISAQQGLFADGSVSARSGGAGVEGGRLSVRFEGLGVNDRQVNDLDPLIDSTFFRQDRVLTLGGALGPLPDSDGGFTAAQYAGRGRVQTAWVNSSGFDTVQLSSTNVIEAPAAANAAQPSTVALTVAGALTLAAPQLRVGENTTLALSSPKGSVSLGFANASNYPANENPAASGGSGKLEVSARQIDLAGALTLRGVGSSVIAAQDDVQLRGDAIAANLRPQGSFKTAGDLRISAAQLTPASMTDYSVSVVDNPDARLTIAASDSTPLEPLSAAGSVTLKAPNIDISGRVSAPQGSIIVAASDTVTLKPGAVLSVAGTLDVPLGTVFNGTQWVYTDDPTLTNSNLATPAGVSTALPEKRISVKGATVDVSDKARIDVSGGGDTVAQEFVAGPGGSIDVRQNFVPSAPGSAALVRNTMFALIPARGDHAAPFDPQIYGGLTQDAAVGGSALLRMGQTITLGGGSGIPAGTYTVMPVRYAVLPGAYAVQPVAGYSDLQPGNVVKEAAGTAIVAGRLGASGAGASSARWSGYRVFNGTQFRKLAELRDYSGSAFTTAAAAAAGEVAPRTALDAGALSVAAEQIRLSTDSIRAGAGSKLLNGQVVAGRGAEVSLAAPHLIVTDQPVAVAAGPSDTLVLNAGSLSELKAETLVLGAAASHGDGSAVQRGTLTLSQPAKTVLVGGVQALSAGEVVLTASEQVNVGVGTAIVADASRRPVTGTVAQNGDGASLYVGSGVALPAWARSGTAGAAGDLLLAESARLSGDNVLFDASHEQHYAPSAVLDARRIGLSASRVSLGEVPADAGGLVLNNALLAQFNTADSFVLTSGSAFDVYGRAEVGSSTLKLLTLDGAGFIARADSGQAAPGASATVTARELLLRNSAGGALDAGLTGGSGTLTLLTTGGEGASGNVTLGGGDLAARGFATTQVVATGQAGSTAAQSKAGTGQLLLKGKGSLTVDGDLTLDAARIAAGSGATQSITAAGVLRTEASSAASGEPSQALGATLALAGQRIEHGGRIELPSGAVSLTATGTGAADDVRLGTGSRISVAGSTQDFAGQTADASAGAVTLSAAAGSVRALAGSTIDLHGTGSNGDAGALRLNATQGTLQLDGQLLARAGSAARGAELTVDVGRLPDLGTVSRPLAAATGGAQALSLDVRVRNGDVHLNADDTVSAHSIRIAADGGDSLTRAGDGQVLINGRLDASGPRAGRVELSARDSVALGSGSLIQANSSGAGEEGGSVLLSARINAVVPNTLDAIVIHDGAKIDVSALDGQAAGAAPRFNLGGTVTLRAPSVGSNEVAIAALPSDHLVQGTREEIVEATLVKSYGNTNLALNASGSANAANPLPTLMGNLQTYSSNLAANSAVSARLATGNSGATFAVRPGLEIQTSGNIAVASAIDFTSGLGTGTPQWRYGGSTYATSQPGALTLRAGGDVTLNGGLLDGFQTVTGNKYALLSPYAAGDSWRYQITAGSDLKGAAAAAVKSTGSTGSVTLKPVGSGTAIIRTGTGRIDIAAAKDITLTGSTAAIYSGGTVAANAGGYASSDSTVNSFNPTFTEHGGGIALQAGNDIVASVASTQLINNWLWRAGRSDASGNFLSTGNAPTAWWVNAATFTQGVGALGGADLSIQAGHNVKSLTAVVPSNGYATVDRSSGVYTGTVENNLGSLDVRAGAAIVGGTFYAQSGALNLRADSIANGSNDPVILAQGGNTARVQARAGLEMFGSFNPTWAPALNVFDSAPTRNSAANAAFTTYSEDSKLDVRSLAGNVSLAGGTSGVRLPTTGDLALNQNRNAGVTPMWTVLPGSDDFVSFGGDVKLGQINLMAPSESGQLRILANGNVVGVNDGAVVMSGLSSAALPGMDTPLSTATWGTAMRANLLGGVTVDGTVVRNSYWGLTLPANYTFNTPDLPHASDTQPAQVVARLGDVASLRIEVPKPLHVEAGGNVSDVQFLAQNLNADSLTQVHAGGSIVMTSNNGNLTVTGPGVAEVLAGGAINLGTSDSGIVSRGNLINPRLPAAGADLIVAAGLGRGSNGFVQQPDYSNVLRQFVTYDAFAAAGKEATALNAQVLNDADFSSDPAKADAIRAQLKAALADRSGAAQAGSSFDTWLASLPAATRMRLALELAQRVQAVANQRFVATGNTESFAPGYLSFNDMFPVLSANVAGLRQFVANNPFAGADQAAALQRQTLKGLPDALATVLLQGLSDPAQASDAQSAFNLALARLDPALLASGSRQLMAQVQTLAGSTLDALRVAGRVDAKVGTPFAKGLDELARAFSPAGPLASNDITVVFSQIKAEQSGNVALLAPRGGVLAGLANPPAGSTGNKQAYQLGVLTLGGGDITSLVRDNFDVYRSRVFTVAGGDIHLWSSLGNIDAGRGPRDTVVAPPPVLVVDNDTGLVTLDITSSVSGSGIGALKTQEDQAPSNIRLIAPNGFIDAGEAGIRAETGTVTLGTNIVLNGGNINAGGGVSGGAVAVAPPAPLPPSSSAGQADKAVEQTQKALSEQQQAADERAKKERRKRVTGEFIGFGDD